MAIDRRTRHKLEAELAVLLKKGRLERAALVLRAILEKDPDDDRLHVKLAEVSLKLGDVEGVRRGFRGAAAAAERKGFYLRAMAALRQLARHQPPAERPWSELSTLAMRLGLVGDALGFLDEGIRAWEAEGDRPAVLQATRRAHQLAPDDAHRTLRLALELRRDHLGPDARALLAAEAARHQAAGRTDAWLALAAELSGLSPDDRNLACQVAAAFLDRREPRKALQRLQPAIRDRAQHLDSLRLLVRAFEVLGQPTKRLAALRELARALSARGRDAAARPHWEELLAVGPADGEARRALGLAAEPDEEVVDLASEGEEVLEELPADAAYADLSDDLAHAEFLVAHRFAEEASSLLAALEQGHPGHPEVAALRSRLLAGPPVVHAHPVAPPATTLPPPGLLLPPLQHGSGPAGEPVDLDVLGAVALVPAEEVLAQFQAQVALTVAPDDAATHYDLGIAYREMGLTTEAQAEFELAAGSATSPRAIDALVGVALCQVARGGPGAAARTLKRAMTHPALTPVGAAAVLYELGAIREETGDAGGAAWAFRAAERSVPRFRDAAARAERCQPGAAPAGGDALGLLPDRA
jgi:tetratricopeptide (TPR) repeat protein